MSVHTRKYQSLCKVQYYTFTMGLIPRRERWRAGKSVGKPGGIVFDSGLGDDPEIERMREQVDFLLGVETNRLLVFNFVLICYHTVQGSTVK